MGFVPRIHHEYFEYMGPHIPERCWSGVRAAHLWRYGPTNTILLTNSFLGPVTRWGITHTRRGAGVPLRSRIVGGDRACPVRVGLIRAVANEVVQVTVPGCFIHRGHLHNPDGTMYPGKAGTVYCESIFRPLLEDERP